MERVIFLCELPPPFGGVTVKNQLIVDTVISSNDAVQIVDFCEIKRKPLKAIFVFARMVSAFARKNSIVYGFGSHSRLKQALTLQKLIGGRLSLEKTVNVIMGGRFQEYVKEDSKLKSLLSSIKLNLVETKGMQEAFKELSLQNADVFPNARLTGRSRTPVTHDGELRCVFFSKISEDKGVDYILSELDGVEGITVDFYGHIDSGIKDRFEIFINDHNYAHYNGVFDATKEDVYAELSKYDVLLLPTKWRGEGVPGILVESKMAGITAIVSNMNYNAEIVQDGAEGIVLEDLKKGSLFKAVESLASDKDRLTRLKEGSYQSRSRYAMESYIKILRTDFGLEE
jgi:glycosyltransferase involved in cell wall biosynthesis